MKLVSYKLKGKPSSLRIGYVRGEEIIDLHEASIRLPVEVLPTDPNQFYKLGNKAIEVAKKIESKLGQTEVTGLAVQLGEAYLSTPIPAPSKIICIGKNYAEHAAEMDSNIPDYPVLFAKYQNALIGPEDRIEKSNQTGKLDYEVELTVVIGKEASNVKREEALDYIAGYTIGNDISARDLQKRTPQWLQGKSLDRSTPIGPWIVTADEVGNPGNLAIQSSVNGEVRQSSNTNKLMFDVPFLIEFISELITLQPGDIILTGTPEGVAMGMDSPKFLQVGDKITLEIEKIGQMENTVGTKN
ncbi:fumarylacetoacetate hydrolase family protein [Ornithinibacillus halophilus]|uniref:Acylpyruvate hydrolase n=1 Tax=Ornithinibacillus halophilus TaxID=930117 RepID=A0A1M5KAW2_9BACI|nr:fumarylacetoacetate hydrolase family protein [Ornithinibacillus halophilus]SHG49770.1 acylpyruvate hydrolase [Ornithinibacillus halophilus]